VLILISFYSPYIQRITNDAREDEMEDNLKMVGSNLSNLKNMAQDMGNVIERQNKQLDRMGDKVKSFQQSNYDKMIKRQR